MKKRDHLPLIGIGPVIVGFQIAVTAVGIVLSRKGFLDFGIIALLNIPLKIIGTLLIVFGAYLYLSANLKSKVFHHITENKLVTTGVYGMVRNPIYSASLLVCTGAVCIANNIALFAAPILGWLFMTIVLQFTEEKWLTALYGEEYLRYCQQVNRCIPWFAKSK